MYRKLLILLGFVFILAGCSNTYDTKIDTYKTAVLEKDTEALIDIIEMEDEPLTEDEAEGYLKLIHEQYDEESLTKELTELVDTLKKGTEEVVLSPKKQNDYSLLTVTKIENKDIRLSIPRYELATNFPEGQFPVKFGINDLTVNQPYMYEKVLGKSVPMVKSYSGNGKKGNTDVGFSIDIDFNKNADERVKLSGDLYAVEINLDNTRLPIKSVSVDGNDITDTKYDENIYYFKSDSKEVVLEVMSEYKGKDFTLDPVNFNPDFFETTIFELEVPEESLANIEQEIKDERAIDLQLKLLAVQSENALSNKEKDRNMMLKHRFADNELNTNYINYINEIADTNAKFTYEISKAEPIGEHSDYTYNVEVEITKNDEHLQTNNFTFKFIKKDDSMIIKEYTKNK